MKQFSIIFFLALWSGVATSLQAGPVKIIGFIDANQCSSCNSISVALKKHPSVLRAMHFVFSGDESTIEQGKEFIYQILGVEAKVELNTQLVNRLRILFKYSKAPQVILYDTLTGEIPYSMPLDSIGYRIDLFEHFVRQQQPYGYKVTDNPRISRLIGWKNIGVAGNKLFVTPLQGASKIYYLDLSDGKPDSICIDDHALQRVYDHLGKKGKVDEVRKYHEKHGIPIPMYKFSSDAYTDDSLFYSYLEIYYYDPFYTGDTIAPDANILLVSFNPVSRQLQINRQQSIELNLDNDNDRNDPAYLSDFTIKYRLNDSIWIASCDKIERSKDTIHKTKLFYRYRMNPSGHLVLAGIYDSITFKDLKTFAGKHFNDLHTYNGYSFVAPFVFFAQADQLYDVEQRRQISLKKQLPDATWIFDMNVTTNAITILYQQKDGSIRITMLNRQTYEPVCNKKVFNPKLPVSENQLQALDAQTTETDLKYMSNLKLVNDRIIYINKSGKVIELFPVM